MVLHKSYQKTCLGNLSLCSVRVVNSHLVDMEWRQKGGANVRPILALRRYTLLNVGQYQPNLFLSIVKVVEALASSLINRALREPDNEIESRSEWRLWDNSPRAAQGANPYLLN